MTRKSGLKTWPPLWTATRQDKDDKPIGEVGTLEDIMMSDLVNNKVFMFMQYQGLRYMGFMVFSAILLRDLSFTKIQCGPLNQRDRRLGPVLYALKPNQSISL
jgi:hypothetical protein